MTASPRYTVTVTNATRGWSYTVTHDQYGPTVNVAALPDVLLADGLEYRWGFESDQLPGRLEPPDATVRLWARDAKRLPAAEKGDRITVNIRLGTTGPRILAPAAMKVTAAETTLTNHPQYAAQLVLRLIDPTAELPAITPLAGVMGEQGITGMNAPSLRWRTRFAELSVRLQRAIAVRLGWWIDDERPLQTTRTNGAGNVLRGLDQPELTDTGQRVGSAALYRYKDSAADVLQKLLNAHHPLGISGALVAAYSSAGHLGYISGYGSAAPTSYWYAFNDANATSGGPIPAFTTPLTDDFYAIVPASRAVKGSTTYLPLVFAVLSGQLTLAPNPSSSSPLGHRPLALDAAWCEVPAQFRKAREHAANLVNIGGMERIGVSQRAGSRQYVNGTAQLADGTVARDYDTALDLGTAAEDAAVDADRFFSAEAPVIAAAVLTDDTQRTSWTPDAFTVHLSRMDASVVNAVAPRICPRQPGETDGDDQLVRHATVYRLPDNKRFPDGQPITGFVVRGQLQVARGDIVWQLTITPGLPRYVVDAAPAPITVGIVDAASYQAQPCSTIDPRIRVADLAYVAA